MPVHFTCPHCGQLLSVTRRKIGQPVQCVRCRGGVLVPPPPTEPDGTHSELDLRQTGEDPQEDPQIGSPPIVPSIPPESYSRPFGGGTVELTRTALYTIGGLIAGVAIIAFLLGWSFGSELGISQNSGASTPRKISGQIMYATKQGRKASDSEAVVIVWPTKQAPDEKLEVAGLRPDVAPANVPKAAIQVIRSLGGDFARTDRNGSYELELPSAGEYYVLIISNHVSTDRQPTTVEVIQIGRYVKKATELLSDNDYVWSKQIVTKPVTLDHVFGG